uniref:cysteine dioxygenase n=1 Tax=Oryza sativa subsp. japonica TaxID=39947 RepID=Q8H4P4_ORYSJ|nr:HGWP repeat containing protein-like [Oryza sativa Japonica Group]
MALSLSLTLQEWISQNITTGSPRPPPTGASACTAGLLCRRCWASTSSPTGRLVRRRLVLPPARLAYYAAVVGRLRLHRPACLRRRRLVFPPARLAFMPPLLGVYVFTDWLAFAAADWSFRLHGWPIMPPLLGIYVFTDRPPRPLPTGASACTAGLYAAVVGRLRLHRPAASSAADWCFRLHGWPIMPPLLGVYVFTDRLAFAAADWCFRLHGWPLCRRCWASTSSPTGLPSPLPTGVSACTAGLYAAVVGRLRRHRPACLRRCRLVFSPARLAFMLPLLGVYVFTDRLAFAAADWCFRLHGWPIMPPLLGVYVFTDRLAFAAAGWCFRLHGWPLCRRCWASTSSPTGLPSPLPTGVSACTAGLYAAVVGRLRLHRPACLRRYRLVLPPARLAYYAAVVGRLRLHRPACLRRCRLVFPPARLAFMPPLLGVYVFTNRPPHPPLLTGVSACTAGLYAAVIGRLHRPVCLRRCRLVFSPARLAFMLPLLGVYVFTDRLAFAAADWCFRLHGWPIMPPLLGIYVFTDRLAFAAAGWCFHLHGWPLCRRCWASTSSPTGLPSPLPTGVSACTAGLYAAVVGRLRLHRPACLRRCRLVLPPARLAYYAAVVGRLRLHRPACLRRCRLVFPPARLAFMPPLLGVYVFTNRPPHPPLLTGVSACTAGLYAAVIGRLHRPVCLRRCRLVFPPARLAFMPPLLGVYVFTDRPPRPPPTGASACTAGLLCRRCWASTSSPTGLPSPLPTGVSACTAGLYAAVVGRLRLHQPATASAADWCHRLHGWPVITPTDAIFFTAGYIAVTTNRHQYLQHKLPTFAMAADWFLHFHGRMILLVLIGLTIFITGRLVCC